MRIPRYRNKKPQPAKGSEASHATNLSQAMLQNTVATGPTAVAWVGQLNRAGVMIAGPDGEHPGMMRFLKLLWLTFSEHPWSPLEVLVGCLTICFVFWWSVWKVSQWLWG